MTTEPAYYDAAMAGNGAPALLRLKDSPWLPLYQEAAGWIPRNHAVVDLGCGTGTFLRCLEAERHEGDRVGIDFSEAALEAAARYLTTSRNRLEVADLREWQPDEHRPGNTTYTCLEVLEHLADDLDLVRRIPPGHQFVLSVPNYESEAHARWFRTCGEAWERYGGLLEFSRWSLIRFDARKAIHVFDTSRRLDSW